MMREFAAPDTKRRSNLLRFLQHELYVYPGRYNAMVRYLLSSVIVIVISMTLNVPQLSYSLLVVFFATQQNIVLTRIIFPLFMLINTLAVICAILILKFTIEYPMIRLLSTATALIILLYLMRASKKLGPVYFCVAITITYAQSFVDVSSNGETLLRNLLWTLVAGGYANGVAYIVNTLVLPVEPARQLQQEIERILTQVSSMLKVVASGNPVTTVSLVDIQRNMLTLYKFLKFSVMRDAHYRENEEQYLVQIAAIERLYSATSNLHNLTMRPLKPEIVSNCRRLSKECQRLLQSIQRDEIYDLTLKQQELIQVMALPDCLREMYSALVSISLQRSNNKQPPITETQADSAPKRIKYGISYDYIKFGIKTLLSVAICYIFYTSVQWPGVHTSMLTCIIVALPGLGASVEKSLLRISGCLVGSALALFATVFILPHIDSITGLLLMVSPVLALGGWVAAGSERSSYAGIQIMYAFSLAMFTDFSPSPELSEIRDRVIGILLGITVSMLVFASFWPESKGKTLRKSIADLFAYFARKMSPVTLEKNTQIIGWSKLDFTQKLLTQTSLEPNWRSNDNEQLTYNCQILLNKLRELHVAFYKFETEYILAIKKDNQDELFALIDTTMNTLATDMETYGKGLLNEPVTSISVGEKLEHDIREQLSISEENPDDIQTPWKQSLLLHAEEVIAICRSIPIWNTDS
ncbi:TPA: FUSC family protein [Serratia marcescens]|nr:FUSC family protein [Serratia marcescens]